MKLSPFSVHILGIDPGFASLGWAVIEYDGSTTRCLAADVIRTKKSKQKVLSWEDNQRRCEELADAMEQAIVGYNVSYIVVEAESWTRTASDKLLGLARGVIYTMSWTHGLALVQHHATTVRKTLLGKAGGSKTDIETWLGENIDGAENHLSNLTKTQRQHAADGAAVAVTDIRRGRNAKLFLSAGQKLHVQRLPGRGTEGGQTDKPSYKGGTTS